MANQRKKQDDKNLKLLREIVAVGGNRQCFDCGQKGPTYVNMTLGSFVCTRCSGMLRGLTPPHRVKSISMATFTQEEIDLLRSKGNDECAKTWMGLWDPSRIHTQDQRELMIEKYERKRYYLEPGSPLKSIPASNGKLNVQSTQNQKSLAPPSHADQSNNNNNNIADNQINNRHRPHRNLIPESDDDPFNKSPNSREPNAQSNGFKQDGGAMNYNDFVADFNSVKIFNAAEAVSNAKTLHSPNANSPQSTNSKGTNENFADFEHNQIYNAAGLPMSHSSTSNSLYSNGTLNSGTTNSTPSADRYAALKDLDDQFRESKENQSMGINNQHQQTQPSINPANPFKANGTYPANPFHSQLVAQPTQNIWSNVQQPVNSFNSTSMATDDPFNTSININHTMSSAINFEPVSNVYNSGFIQPNPFNGIKASQNNPFL